MTTFAPISAIRSAIARPIPRVEPVISATLSVMSNNTCRSPFLSIPEVEGNRWI